MSRNSADRLDSYNDDPPPPYDSVASADEEGLPSYEEAVERMLMQEAGNSSSSNYQFVLIDERNSTNSGDTSNRPDRRPRICDDLPPSLRHIAFSFAMDGGPRRFTQSARHENTGSEHGRVHFSSRNNQERIVTNGTEVIQIFPEPTNAIYEHIMDDGGLDPDSQSERRARSEGLRVHYSIANNGDEVIQIFPPPTGAISELFSSILEDVVIDDSQSQGNSGSDSLNVHYSADNNGTDGRPWIWKLLTRDQCLYQVGPLLLFVIIIGFLIYDKLIKSSS